MVEVGGEALEIESGRKVVGKWSENGLKSSLSPLSGLPDQNFSRSNNIKGWKKEGCQ